MTFEPGVSTIDAEPDATVDALAAKLRAALSLAEESGQKLEIALVGRADEVGPLNINLRLSERRAHELQRLLADRGLPVARLCGAWRGRP